ncbi:MAG: Clp protease N-terminal domain-containing protein, partial [Sciscionella sp.]
MPAYFGPSDNDPKSFDDFLARMFGSSGVTPGGGPSQARRIDISTMMTEQAQQLLVAAARYAGERGHAELDSLHLIIAMTQDEQVSALLTSAGGDVSAIATDAERKLPGAGTPNSEQRALTAATKQTLLEALQAARALGSTYIGPEHILLAMVANPNSTAGRLLAAHGVAPERIGPAVAGSDGTPDTHSATPTLDQYATDLTAAAQQGKLDPVIGRAEEIEQTLEVLSRRSKNNPVLIGEAGVGKTAIVEGIAQRIANDEVPAVLTGKRLLQLDLSGMLAGTRYRGDFEERMTKVIDEVTAHRDELIVFLDELHTVVGAGGAEGAVDAGNMLKPRLARGELHLIGATTLDEYRRSIEKDAALERRFQPVHVAEPSRDDAVAILTGLKERYEEHHKVRYTDEAITAAVTLSDRYISDRQLPDKA